MNDPLKASILDRIKAQAGGGGHMTVIMMGGEDDQQKKKLDQELKEEGKPPTLKQKIDDSKEGKEAAAQENQEGVDDPEAGDEDQSLIDDLMSQHDQDLAERDHKNDIPAKGLFGKMKHGLIGKKLAKDSV